MLFSWCRDTGWIILWIVTCCVRAAAVPLEILLLNFRLTLWVLTTVFQLVVWLLTVEMVLLLSILAPLTRRDYRFWTPSKPEPFSVSLPPEILL